MIKLIFHQPNFDEMRRWTLGQVGEWVRYSLANTKKKRKWPLFDNIKLIEQNQNKIIAELRKGEKPVIHVSVFPVQFK